MDVLSSNNLLWIFHGGAKWEEADRGTVRSWGEGSGEVTEGRDGRGRVGAMKCDMSDGWEAGRGYMAFATELG